MDIKEEEDEAEAARQGQREPDDEEKRSLLPSYADQLLHQQQSHHRVDSPKAHIPTSPSRVRISKRRASSSEVYSVLTPVPVMVYPLGSNDDEEDEHDENPNYTSDHEGKKRSDSHPIIGLDDERSSGYGTG